MSRSKTSSDASFPKKGCLIVLSAPSGCGKTTITDRLLKRHADWVRSVSITTRKPRENEKDGSDYFFVSPEEFRRMDEKGELLESAKVFDYYYGTPKKFILDQLRRDKKVLLTIDVQGTKKVKKLLDGKVSLLTIFVLPPSVKVLRDRLEGRQTESVGEMELRIQTAQDEIKEAGRYDATVINQNLDQTILDIENLIEQYLKENTNRTKDQRPKTKDSIL